MSDLHLSNLTKRFGSTVAVNDVSLDVAAGDIVCLLGPSGCGKTTLLRLVAGLEQSDGGSVLFDNQDITRVPLHKRGFGMMFQNFALFPHLNVGDNVGYGLKMLGLDSAEIATRTNDMLALVDMTGYNTRKVDELSGGQQQRVALARALATRPKLLMLDEPLGALDRALREHLMVELRNIIKNVGVTAIYVTHDQSEAYAIADHVAIMNEGEIEQYAPPQTVYNQPQSAFVARFLGFENVVAGNVIGARSVDSPIGPLMLAADVNREIGKAVEVLIRPNAITLRPTENAVTISEITVTFRGRYSEIQLQVGTQTLVFEVASSTPWLAAGLNTCYLQLGAIQILE